MGFNPIVFFLISRKIAEIEFYSISYMLFTDKERK